MLVDYFSRIAVRISSICPSIQHTARGVVAVTRRPYGAPGLELAWFPGPRSWANYRGSLRERIVAQ